MASRMMALLSAVLLLGASSGPGPENPTDRASYSLGHQIGRDLAAQGSRLDLEAMRQGLRDGLSGSGPALDPAAMQRVLAELKRRIDSADRAREREEDLRRLEEGREFLSRNAKRAGVVTLESGLQYQVLDRGSGRSPGPGDKVIVHYRGTTVDGRIFHDSHVRPGKPETLHVSGVVSGLTEAFQLMSPGARWRIFLPPDLAYGRRGPLAGHAIIFEIELLSIVPAAGAGR